MSSRYWLLMIGFAVTAAPVMAQSVVEVRDAQGQLVLVGQFDALDERERFAALGPAGANMEASGEVEMNGRTIEVTVRDLAPRARFTIRIDGRDVALVTTNGRGRAEFEEDTTVATIPTA